MRLTELVRNTPLPQPDFSNFLRSDRRKSLPPLDVEALDIVALIQEQREAIKIPTNGEVSFLLRYRGYEGGVLSLGEDESGEVWNVLQVQGARSRRSYRVDSGMRWPSALASSVDEYANIDNADVRHITMRPLCEIDNICEAVSTTIGKSYLAVISSLGMRFSDDMRLYVKDVDNSK